VTNEAYSAAGAATVGNLVLGDFDMSAGVDGYMYVSAQNYAYAGKGAAKVGT